MIIEIDQSGKVENTNQNTAIAFTNEISKSLLIKAKDKREIQKIFRQIGKSKNFVYKLFSILIFFLIKKIDEIIINEEYSGWGFQIKDYFLTQIRKVKPDFDKNNINFRRIGRKSKAHSLAYTVYKNKRKPDLEVDYKEILRLIK